MTNSLLTCDVMRAAPCAAKLKGGHHKYEMSRRTPILTLYPSFADKTDESGSRVSGVLPSHSARFNSQLKTNRQAVQVQHKCILGINVEVLVYNNNKSSKGWGDGDKIIPQRFCCGAFSLL